MDVILPILSEWGNIGMFIAAFLAGSVLPFSSEAVLTFLLLPNSGVDPTSCVVAASLGNTLGGMTCYWLGSLGNEEWIEKYLHIKKRKIAWMKRYLNGRGSFMAFFAFLPLLGSVIVVTLGLLRIRPLATLVYMCIGKTLRYVLVALAALGLFSLF
ncbi:MAG: VTT domain-containing protein [Bacteroidaceae bacterium]|nr:VTT domain-containing protein [Bacteroidaceae bacterium]